MLTVFATLALTGCASAGYYAQSITGHFGLMLRARPIETVLSAPETDPRLVARLRTALDVRDFASGVLGLPANASYRRYAALDRRYVVWNVVAAPELSLAPRHWCFPFAGCLSYRGYFSESDAAAFAAGLASEGWDVTVAGVRAYSTLGWFDDPLSSPMVEQPAYSLAGLVFHELAHQRLYVPGDTEFNESFAVVVERAGVTRWIEAAARAGPGERERYRIAAERRAAFLALVRDARRDLEAVYASSRSDAEKRAAKAERIDRLRARYTTLRSGWRDGPSYDGWFERGVNNAALALVTVYDRWVPALEALLARSGGDLEVFYRACDALAKLPPAERRAGLEALEQAGAISRDTSLRPVYRSRRYAEIRRVAGQRTATRLRRPPGASGSPGSGRGHRGPQRAAAFRDVAAQRDRPYRFGIELVAPRP